MSRNTESVQILKKSIIAELKRIAAGYGITIQNEEPADIFADLIYTLYEKYGHRVILLIDEYDKPILDAIDDLDRAREIRTFLQGFYTVIKSFRGPISGLYCLQALLK